MESLLRKLRGEEAPRTVADHETAKGSTACAARIGLAHCAILRYLDMLNCAICQLGIRQ